MAKRASRGLRRGVPTGCCISVSTKRGESMTLPLTMWAEEQLQLSSPVQMKGESSSLSARRVKMEAGLRSSIEASFDLPLSMSLPYLCPRVGNSSNLKLWYLICLQAAEETGGWQANIPLLLCSSVAAVMSVGVSRGQWVTVAQEPSLTFSPPLFLKTPEDEVFFHLHVIQAKKLNNLLKVPVGLRRRGNGIAPKPDLTHERRLKAADREGTEGKKRQVPLKLWSLLLPLEFQSF